MLNKLLLEDLQALVRSDGWIFLARKLQGRKSRHLSALLRETSTVDLGAVRDLQARINEIDFLLAAPDREINELRREQLGSPPEVASDGA